VKTGKAQGRAQDLSSPLYHSFHLSKS
jgi:hypothetical protein